MKKRYFLFILICFLFSLTITKADTCTYKEQSRLIKEASNIKITSELPYKKPDENLTRTVDGTFDESGKNVENTFAAYMGYYFKVYISNLTEEFQVTFSEKLYNKSGNLVNKVTIDDVQDGVIELYTYDLSKNRSITFTIVSNTVECKAKQLRKKRANIPKYNSHSASTICEEYKDLDICDPFYSKDLTDVQFLNKIEEIRNPQINKDKKLGIFATIWLFLTKYWWIVLIIVLLIGGGIFLFLNYKRRHFK